MNVTPNNANAKTYEKITQITIVVNSVTVYDATFNSEKKFSDLPFFCFSNDDASSIEELNFNNLKKCNPQEKFKYMGVFLGNFENVKTTNNSLQKKFDTWHSGNNCANVEIAFQNNSQEITFYGKIEKIFYKDFSPQITSAT